MTVAPRTCGPRPRATLLAEALAAAQRGDEDARWELVAALQVAGDEATFDQCAAWCASASSVERRLAADVLGQLGGSGLDAPFRELSCGLLLNLLRDPEPRVLQGAAVALGHLTWRGDLGPLLTLATHPSADVRHGVVLALSGNDSPIAVETLIRLSADADSHVRDWATFGLGAQSAVDTEPVRDALAARLDDTDDDTRAEALSGLAARGDPRAAPAVLRELRSRSVGRLTVEAARDFPSPAFLDALSSLEAWWDVDPALLRAAITRCREAARGAPRPRAPG